MLKKAISLVMVSLLLITQGGCDMANIKTLYGSDKLREAYPKVNENFNELNGDINVLRTRVNTIITTPIDGEAAAQELVDARDGESSLGERLERDLQVVESHLAETATRISSLQITKADKTEVNAVNLRVDNLVIPISPENVNVEVTDAHNSIVKNKNFPSLKARLEESEQDLETLKLDYSKQIERQLDFELLELNADVKNEIVVENGEVTHIQKAREYVLQESDLTSINKHRQYIDTITISTSNMVGVVPAEPFSKPVFKIDGFTDSGKATIVDEIQSIGTYVYSSNISTTLLVLIVEKDKYATIDEVRAALAGTKIIYQLESPITTEITDLSYNTRWLIDLDQKIKTLESSLLSKDVKVPKAPLKLNLVGETDPEKTGIRYLTTGWHDKALYGVARMKIFRAAQVDDPDTWEMGVNLPTTIYERILHLHVSNKGIVLITKKSGENPKVWFMQDINSEPELRHEFIFTPSTDTLNDFNITGHSDGVNDYIIACQYGMGTDHVRNMYLSTDMGLTWEVINQSQITTPGDLNSHWHTAKYDPYMGRIWAVEGDSSNKAISYSDDLGKTWVRLSGGIYQPTLIYPFPKRVVFGRDRGISPPGIDQWIRSDVPFEQKYITESLSFREDKFAYQNYPSQQISGYGEEIYINFTKRSDIDEQYIYATGDGGESWHCVYSGSVGTGIPYLGNPSGVTADGKIAFALYGYGEGGLSTPLVYADAIEWE